MTFVKVPLVQQKYKILQKVGKNYNIDFKKYDMKRERFKISR